MSTSTAKEAVFVKSEPYLDGINIAGPDFNQPMYELNELLNSYATIGFQASGLSRAIELVNKMVRPSFFLFFL